MTVFSHVNPPKGGRAAKAPYNFVPPPQWVWDAPNEEPRPWEAHDRYLMPTHHHGWIDLEIETLTPLFIRGPVRLRKGGWDTRDARERPEPWATADGRPVIPGSSLRGMLRTLVEILTFAKITPVSDAKPFFRTFAPDRVGKAYGARVAPGGDKPEGGFLERREGGWAVQPAMVLRVDHRELRDQGFGYRVHPNYKPSWDWQQRRCWVQYSDDRVSAISPQRRDGWTEGTLVLTGSMMCKHTEYVLVRDADAEPVDVPFEVWDRFHDEYQLTAWQEDAFPVDEPHKECREAKGHLRDGEPIFFVRGDDSRVGFLGRARMFRFPYDRSLQDLVPSELRTEALDRAEALFGRVTKERPIAVKGRVFVEDAVALGDGDWLEPEMTPRVLGSPKPTTFPHYLTQDGRRPKRDLTTYLKDDETTIRGHKLYWHRWDERGLALVEANPADVARTPKQYTKVRPVRAGVRFAGRLRFGNLTDVELGALLAALRLPDGCAHKLGMGKPLGLGSVRIACTLRIVDRARRYGSWEDTGEEPAERAAETERRCQERFEEAVLAHARSTGEALLPGRSDLRRIARLDALFTLLRWDGRPPRDDTDYLPLAEFRERNVLPTPHRVAGLDEPAWPGPPPGPATDDRPPGRGGRQARPGGPHRRVALDRADAAVQAPARPSTAVGSLVRCRVLKERTKKGGWLFLLPDGRQGVLAPSSPEPPDLVPGLELDLVLVTDPPPGDRAQLRRLDPVPPQPAPKRGSSKDRRDGKRGRRP